MNVFVIDSPNPFDILDGRNEHRAVEEICKSMGHKVYPFFVKSKKEFKSTIKYISSVDDFDSKKSQRKLCLHISSHGTPKDNGMAFGKDNLSWEQIADILIPILEMKEKYEIIILLSACGTNKQTLTNSIEELVKTKKGISPPGYILAFNEDAVAWRDALLIWTIFYHQISEVEDKEDMQKIIDIVKESGFSDLMYKRWDEDRKKYLKYGSKSDS